MYDQTRSVCDNLMMRRLGVGQIDAGGRRRTEPLIGYPGKQFEDQDMGIDIYRELYAIVSLQNAATISKSCC